jgi:hypothetical protein
MGGKIEKRSNSKDGSPFYKYLEYIGNLGEKCVDNITEDIILEILTRNVFFCA